MKKSLFRAMIPTIALILVGLMSLTGITYAWFTSNTSATVDTITFSVAQSSSLMISTTGRSDDWDTSVSLPNGALGDISTAGELNDAVNLKFFDGVDVDLDTKVPASYTATFDGQLYKQTLYLKNEAAEAATVTLTGTTLTVDDSKTYAGNSTDAARIGIVKKATGTVAANTTTVITPTTLTKAEAQATVIIAEADPETYNAINDASGSVTSKTSTAFASSSFTIDANQIVQIDLYIWIEGTDAQCTNSVAGVPFTADIVFAS